MNFVWLQYSFSPINLCFGDLLNMDLSLCLVRAVRGVSPVSVHAEWSILPTCAVCVMRLLRAPVPSALRAVLPGAARNLAYGDTERGCGFLLAVVITTVSGMTVCFTLALSLPSRFSLMQSVAHYTVITYFVSCGFAAEVFAKQWQKNMIVFIQYSLSCHLFP